MPSNPEVLNRLLVKVDRAEKHIHDLDAEFLKFIGTADPDKGAPYDTPFEDDFQTGQRTWYLRVVREIPAEFSAMVGDIVQNLRSALDHLAWHLVQNGPVTPKAKDRDIYFPIYESASKYRADKMRKMQGMSDLAIKAIDDIQPYYRLDGPGIGNGVHLFLLDKINNFDKHRLLIPAWTSMVAHSITKSKRIEMDAVIKGASLDPSKVLIAASPITKGPLQDGCKLCTLPISEVEGQMAFQFHIAFGEPEWACGKEVRSTLFVIHKRVKDIMLRFDRENLL